jgi:hypothetical protein
MSEKNEEIQNPFDESFREVTNTLTSLITLHNSVLNAADTETRFCIDNNSYSTISFSTDSAMQKEMLLFLRREIQEEINILNGKGVVNIQINGLNEQ